MRVALLGACLLLAACATLPRLDPGPAPPELAVWRDGIDWQAAGDEAVRVLAGYLQTDTMNPPGNETRGAQYLAEVLDREGIASEILEFAPGRGSLLARVKGDGTEAPLCLLSHIDVVTAENEHWPKDRQPLSGVVHDGMLWGRGALDMKGMGALEALTLVWLKRRQVPLRRDVILVAVADEEVDNQGMKYMVKEHWARIGCSHAVNEGGLGLRDVFLPGQTVFAVSVAEKGLLWLKMTARGPAGHGSTPLPGRAPEKLLKALDKLRQREPEPHMHASLRQTLAQVGHEKGGVAGFVLVRPTLVDLFVEGKLMAADATRAGLTNTLNITGFSGGSVPNVVPSTVGALLDCRLLPGTTPEAMLAELKALVADPDIAFEVLHSASANASTWDDPFFRALSRHAVDGLPGAVAGPVLSVGFTDSLHLRPLGVRAYGLVPFQVTQAEAESIHGHNERVSIANVHRGLKVLYRAVVDVAAKAPTVAADPAR